MGEAETPGASLDRNLASRLSARTAVIGGSLCLLALLLTGLAITLLPAVRWHDILALRDFSTLATPSARGWENLVAEIVDTGPAFFLGAVIIATALARRRVRVALLATAIMIGASASTELIKALLAVPRHSPILDPQQVPLHSWPSGHSTAIMAIALSAVIVAPRRWRPAVAATGALLALGVAFSVLALKWHFPSDVIGGYLMAGTWACFGVAALRVADDRWPARQHAPGSSRLASLARPVRRFGPALARLAAALAALKSAFGLAAVAVAALLALLVIASQAGGVIGFASSHLPMLGAAAVIAALAVGLSGAAVLALRR